MNKPETFPLNIHDWLGSKHIAAMTPAEEGAYLRLLCYQFDDSRCRLPDDDEILATLSRLNQDWDNGSGEKIRKCFKKEGNFIFNSRIRKEWRKRLNFLKGCSVGGRKSTQPRKPSTGKQKPSKVPSSYVKPTSNLPLTDLEVVLALGLVLDKEKYSQIIFCLSKYLFKLIKRNNPQAKEPNFNQWAKDMDYIIRIDKRSYRNIVRVIHWSQHDQFWKTNILSPEKLRKQFDQLIMKIPLRASPKDSGLCEKCGKDLKYMGGLCSTCHFDRSDR